MVREINFSNLDVLDIYSDFYDIALSFFKDNPFAALLVCFFEDTIVGYLYYSDIYDRIEIDQITVFEKYRRCGYASKMIEFLLKKNKSISLEVNHNNYPAISLYKKFGFKDVAVRSGYYDGEDGILMILEVK